MDTLTLLVERNEAVSEIRRHHIDFAEISRICDDERKALITAAEAIQKIRNIVG